MQSAGALRCGRIRGAIGAAGSRFDLANCQERDYRLRKMIDELGMTLRDEEPAAPATGFKQSSGTLNYLTLRFVTHVLH